MKTDNKGRVIGLSLVLLLGFSAVLQAAIISQDNGDPLTTQASPAQSTGFGGWNLTNVDVKVTDLDFTEIAKDFNKTDGSYDAMVLGDSFESDIYEGNNTSGDVLVNLHGKNWPVGEPAGIKVVHGTVDMSRNRPNNCIMTTSFLETAYLDEVPADETVCSSPFQTHKRFKFNMLPTMVNEVNTTTGGYGEGVDLTFNVTGDAATWRYVVLQKINNYTGKRLDGYKVEVGFLDVDGNFTKASDVLPSPAALSLSIGIDENNGEDIWAPDQLANFSHGLFGPQTYEDPVPHFPQDGFFDNRSAGFTVALNANGDVIESTGLLASNYTALPVPNGAAITSQFGNWLPSIWAPKGIFWDEDNDPATDNTLMAFWGNTGNGTYAWMKGNRDAWAVVTNAELIYWASSPLYSIATIEDVLNLGLTYIVEVGDISNFPVNNFTIRITPHVPVDQTKPGYVTTTPAALIGDVTNTALVSIAPAPTFTIGSTLNLIIADADLVGLGTLNDINISISENVWDVVSLTEVDGRGIFTASLTTVAGFAASITGNELTLKDGSVVSMTYNDGGLDVNASTTATVAPIVYSSSNGSKGIFSTMDDVSLLLMILGFLTIGGFIVSKRLRRQ